MFDQQSPTPNPQPARPSPNMAEDMFAGSDAPMAPQPSAPQSFTPPPSALPPTPPAPHASVPMETAHGGSYVARIIVVVLAVLILLVGAGYAAYRFMGQAPADDAGPVRSVSDDGVINDAVTGKKDAGVAPVVQLDEPEEDRRSFIDSDGDGLTNAEELEAGTLSNKADTDDDGLGDREEVEVYGTDPRNEDTDGDGYLDGQEVKGGYNPNGEGMLFEVPGM